MVYNNLWYTLYWVKRGVQRNYFYFEEMEIIPLPVRKLPRNLWDKTVALSTTDYRYQVFNP